MNRFEITRRKNGEFQFNLKAKNGEIVLTSEGYTTKENCKKGIESVKKNCLIDGRYEKKISANGKPYFNLKASNGEVIGTSQMYESESGRDNGIEAVKASADSAEIVDLSVIPEDVNKPVQQSNMGSSSSNISTNEIITPTVPASELINNTSEVVSSIEDASCPVPPRSEARPSVATSTLGFASTGPTRSSIDETEAPRNGFWGWLKWLLLLLALAALFFIWRSCGRKPHIEELPIVVSEEVIVEKVNTIAEKIQTELTLPNGIVLKAYKGGIEDQLIAFLQSKDYETATDDQLKDRWFNFDNIDFKFASATELEEGSDTQLQNVIEILKYFPNAKVKIGAYTDKIGSEEANMQLSTERAHTIKAIFDKAGINKQIAGAEGYGDKFAVHSKDASDSERATDRRIALRFVK